VSWSHEGCNSVREIAVEPGGQSQPLVDSNRGTATQWQTAVYATIEQNDRDPRFDDVQDFRRLVDDLFDSIIIHPVKDKRYTRWNAFMIFMLGLSAYLVPYEIAFTEITTDYHSIFGFVTDLVFLIDTVLQFFIAFETHGYHYCQDHKQIVWHYLVTGFLVDSLACLSVSNIFVMNFFAQFIWLVTVFRWTRMLRLVRFWRCKRRWIFELGMSYVMQEACINAVTITLSCHWMACAWGVSAKYDTNANWVVAQLAKDDFEMPLGNIMHWPHGARTYFLALYFGIYLLTGIGLGNIVPVNAVEHAVCMTCMIGGAVCWATVIASIVGMVGNQKEADMMLQRQMDAINRLSRHHGIPEELRLAVRQYLTMTRNMGRKHESDVVCTLSPSLQMAVTMKTHGEWLMRVKYFKRLVNPRTGEGTQFLVDIAWSMELRMYQPGEVIKLMHHLCVVARGIGFLEGGVCFRHSVWGSDFLMKSMLLRKSCHVLCLTYMQIKVLSLEQFNTILSHYPQECKAIQRERVKLIVVRGMVHKARQELERRSQDPAWAESMKNYKSKLSRSRSFVDFGGRKNATGLNMRHSHLPSVGQDLETELDEGDDEHQEIVGQANMPEFVAQIKRTQDVFRDDTTKRLELIEEHLKSIAESMENVRTTPWNTAC